MRKFILKVENKFAKIGNMFSKLAIEQPDLFCLISIVFCPFLVLFGILLFIYRHIKEIVIDEKNN